MTNGLRFLKKRVVHGLDVCVRRSPPRLPPVFSVFYEIDVTHVTDVPVVPRSRRPSLHHPRTHRTPDGYSKASYVINIVHGLIIQKNTFSVICEPLSGDRSILIVATPSDTISSITKEQFIFRPHFFTSVFIETPSESQIVISERWLFLNSFEFRTTFRSYVPSS